MGQDILAADILAADSPAGGRLPGADIWDNSESQNPKTRIDGKITAAGLTRDEPKEMNSRYGNHWTRP